MGIKKLVLNLKMKVLILIAYYMYYASACPIGREEDAPAKINYIHFENNHIAFSTNNRMRYNVGNRRGNGNQRGDGNNRNGISRGNKGQNGRRNEAKNVSVLRRKTEGSGEVVDVYNAHNVMLKMNPLELIIEDYDEDYEQHEIEDTNLTIQSSLAPTAGENSDTSTTSTTSSTTTTATRTTTPIAKATTSTIEDTEVSSENKFFSFFKKSWRSLTSFFK